MKLLGKGEINGNIYYYRRWDNVISIIRLL